MKVKLTRKQRHGLQRLIDLEQRPPHLKKWGAFFIGQTGARALRTLDGSGLVEIERRAVNDFRYSITDAGRDALNEV